MHDLTVRELSECNTRQVKGKRAIFHSCSSLIETAPTKTENFFGERKRRQTKWNTAILHTASLLADPATSLLPERSQGWLQTNIPSQKNRPANQHLSATLLPEQSSVGANISPRRNKTKTLVSVEASKGALPGDDLIPKPCFSFYWVFSTQFGCSNLARYFILFCQQPFFSTISSIFHGLLRDLGDLSRRESARQFVEPRRRGLSGALPQTFLCLPVGRSCGRSLPTKSLHLT